MPLQYDHEITGSGLLVPRGAQESSIRAALKAHDPLLMLDYAIDERFGCQVWQVLKRVAPDRPPHVVCRWRDQTNGQPLPLSHSLVDHVKSLDLNSRAPRVDADEENRKHKAALEREADDALEEQAKDLVERLRGTKSHVLPRGMYRRKTQFGNVTDIQ